MFIILSLQSGNQQPHSDTDRRTLRTFHNSLVNSSTILSESTYATGYGNLTGFQLSYDDQLNGKSAKDWPLHHFDTKNPWEENQKYSILPNEVSDRVHKFWGNDPATDKAYLLNISGRANGQFELEETKIKPTKLKIPKYLKEYYKAIDNSFTSEEPTEDNHEYFDKPIDRVGNVTAKTGNVDISIRGSKYNYKDPEIKSNGKKINNAVFTTLDISLKDYPEIETHLLELEGVYFQDTGSLVATTNTAKFYGNYGLPHLTMNDANFHIAQTLMTQYNNVTIRDTVDMDDMNRAIVRAHEQCEYVTFIQFKKTGFSREELRAIDEELENPTGAPLPDEIPQLSISDFLVYSPDCGVVLSKKSLTEFVGFTSEVRRKRARTVLIGVLGLLALQLSLLLREIKRNASPGALSNISSGTFMMLGYIEAMKALVSMLLSTMTSDLNILFITIAAFGFLMSGVFIMRLVVQIFQQQANERGTDWTQILRSANTPATTTTTTTTTTTQPDLQSEVSYSNSIFGFGLFLTIVSIFIINVSFTWRASYRRVFEFIALLILFSVWVPTIFRNTLKNCRKSLTWEFTIGTSVIALIPVYYVCLVGGNVLEHRKDKVLALVVTVWVGVQLSVLWLQKVLGARFWLPENMLPEAYQYHRALAREDLKGGNFKEALAAVETSGGEEIIEAKCTCPICMTDLNLPVVVKEENKKKVNTKEYMITPCDHVFHTECLESWMQLKLQCPVCRSGLPPV
ncbi:TUL1 Transmembrane E3 ubiquitin-protein ligase 1 [Candida maltosa Xu316]